MAAYIQQVKIDAYRTIKDLDVDLRPAQGDARPFRHLILTGPNGSGKSSALELIASHAEGVKHVRQFLDVEWSTPPGEDTILVYIPTHRKLVLKEVTGPSKTEFEGNSGRVSSGLSQQFLQYLVNRRAEQAFANIDRDVVKETELQQWFDRFEGHLRWLFEDPRLTLAFDSKRFNFTIHRGDGSQHGLQKLADGHAAFLLIFAEITLAIESAGGGESTRSELPRGVVILDEIENHLHLRLQEQALPFLTNLFPGFQFITATHSPAVIASVPDAIVYDMALRTATPSADFVGVRYGALMTGHFRLPSDFDLDSTAKLEELKRLAVVESPDPSATRRREELADLLARRSPTLAYEVWRILHEPGLPRGLVEEAS